MQKKEKNKNAPQNTTIGQEYLWALPKPVS